MKQQRSPNWEYEYDHAEQWEVLLADLIHGMVSRANGPTSAVGAVATSRREEASEMYGEQFDEIFELAKELRRLNEDENIKQSGDGEHTPYYAKQ